MKVITQILVLLVLSAVAGILQGWMLGTEGSSVAQDPSALGLDQALALTGAIWVDAREEEDFRTGHYPDAIHLHDGNWDIALGPLLSQWEPGQPIIVYCDGRGCAASRLIATQLREELGMEEVYWLREGWEGLQRAGEIR